MLRKREKEENENAATLQLARPELALDQLLHVGGEQGEEEEDDDSLESLVDGIEGESLATLEPSLQVGSSRSISRNSEG